MIQELADMDPRETYSGCCDSGTRCFFCGAESEPHSKKCLWVCANQSLGRVILTDQWVNESLDDYRRRKALEADIAAYGPLAPRQHVLTAFEATMSAMAEKYHGEVFGQLNIQPTNLSALFDAVQLGSNR